MKKLVSENFKRAAGWKRTLLFIIAVFLIGTAVYQIGRIYLEYKEGTDTYGKILEAAVEKNDAENSEYQEVSIDFDVLKAINEDIIGWIRFDSNGIDYPLLQGEDNEEYLYTMADHTKNPAGSIFVEAINASDFEDAHTIIYGHNMKDLSMFGLLKRYKTEESYYEENSDFTIYTPKMIYRYRIFSYYDADPDDSIYQVGFTADDTFAEFIREMQKRSYRDTKIEVKKTDKIVTLSTCSTRGKRFVVHAKRINDMKGDRICEF